MSFIDLYDSWAICSLNLEWFSWVIDSKIWFIDSWFMNGLSTGIGIIHFRLWFKDLNHWFMIHEWFVHWNWNDPFESLIHEWFVHWNWNDPVGSLIQRSDSWFMNDLFTGIGMIQLGNWFMNDLFIGIGMIQLGSLIQKSDSLFMNDLFTGTGMILLRHWFKDLIHWFINYLFIGTWTILIETLIQRSDLFIHEWFVHWNWNDPVGSLFEKSDSLFKNELSTGIGMIQSLFQWSNPMKLTQNMLSFRYYYLLSLQCPWCSLFYIASRISI